MADSPLISIRCKSEIKNEFQAICEEMGLDMSSAIILFMKQTIIRGEIPFEIQTKKKIDFDKQMEERLIAYAKQLHSEQEMRESADRRD